jgi:hypothetical protein
MKGCPGRKNCWKQKEGQGLILNAKDMALKRKYYEINT